MHLQAYLNLAYKFVGSLPQTEAPRISAGAVQQGVRPGHTRRTLSMKDLLHHCTKAHFPVYRPLSHVVFRQVRKYWDYFGVVVMQYLCGVSWLFYSFVLLKMR